MKPWTLFSVLARHRLSPWNYVNLRRMAILLAPSPIHPPRHPKWAPRPRWNRDYQAGSSRPPQSPNILLDENGQFHTRRRHRPPWKKPIPPSSDINQGPLAPVDGALQACRLSPQREEIVFCFCIVGIWSRRDCLEGMWQGWQCLCYQGVWQGIHSARATPAAPATTRQRFTPDGPCCLEHLWGGPRLFRDLDHCPCTDHACPWSAGRLGWSAPAGCQSRHWPVLRKVLPERHEEGARWVLLCGGWVQGHLLRHPADPSPESVHSGTVSAGNSYETGSAVNFQLFSTTFSWCLCFRVGLARENKIEQQAKLILFSFSFPWILFSFFSPSIIENLIKIIFQLLHLDTQLLHCWTENGDYPAVINGIVLFVISLSTNVWKTSWARKPWWMALHLSMIVTMPLFPCVSHWSQLTHQIQSPTEILNIFFQSGIWIGVKPIALPPVIWVIGPKHTGITWHYVAKSWWIWTCELNCGRNDVAGCVDNYIQIIWDSQTARNGSATCWKIWEWGNSSEIAWAVGFHILAVSKRSADGPTDIDPILKDASLSEGFWVCECVRDGVIWIECRAYSIKSRHFFLLFRYITQRRFFARDHSWNLLRSVTLK